MSTTRVETSIGNGLCFAYELVLVLDDANRPRVSLAAYPDREAARVDAAELANFLSVPLFDEAAAGGFPTC